LEDDMDHVEFKNKVNSYISGELVNDELDEFEIHYFNCLSCRNYLFMHKVILKALREIILSSDIKELESTFNISSILNEMSLNHEKEMKESLAELTKKKITEIDDIIPQDGIDKHFEAIEKKERKKHQIFRKLGRPSAKKIAYEFIKRHFPEELSLFDVAWRVFKNIGPEDFKEVAVSEALGIAGQESSELKTPMVIILLNQIMDKDIKTMQNKNDKEAFIKACRVIGCSQDLIEKVIAFILEY
jgi:hypothetical protein